MALGLTAVTPVSADAADDAPAPDPTAICPGPGQIPDGSFLIFTGNGLDGHVQVFSVTADQLATGGGPNLVVAGDATTPILVNVSGTDVSHKAQDTVADGVNISGPGGTGFGNWASRIMWNFTDATMLDISRTTQFMGSILAPKASAGITPNTNGRLFVGGDLTVSSKGQEHHSFPWIGIDAAPCRAGSVLVRKLVTGDGADAVPADTEYTTHHVATSGRPGAGSMEGDLVVRADEQMVSGPTLDEGDTVTFSEPTPPAVEGIDWGPASIVPRSVEINSGTVPVITVTNTATRTVAQVGTFSLRKALSGVDASAFPTGTVFTVTASWTQDGVAKSQELKLSPDGSVVQGPQDLPVGTVVSFSEAQPAGINGYEFMGAEFTPEEVTIAAGENPMVIATNTYEDTTTNSGYFTIEKKVEGAVAAGQEFAFSYALGYAAPVAVTVKAGETWTSQAIPRQD